MAWIVARKLKTGIRFYVRYSYEGRRYWFSAGKSRRLANLAKGKIEVKIAEGRILDRERRSDWTLGELRTLYLARMAQLKPRSAAWRRDRFAQVVAVLGADLPIETVTLESVDRLVHARLEAGRAVSTVKGDVAVLRHALRQAYRWRGETGLSQFRLADWEPPKDDSAREPVFLSEKETARLLAAARRRRLRGGETGRQGELAIRLALGTGARVSEIAGIRWSDLEGDHLRLRTLKGGPRRGTDLDHELARDLRAIRPKRAAGSDPILPGEPGVETKARYRDFWEAVRTVAKLQHVRFHDLRHTFAAEFLRRGGTLRALQRLLGHRTARMTEKYAHFSKEYEAPKALVWRGATSGTRKQRK